MGLRVAVGFDSPFGLHFSWKRAVCLQRSVAKGTPPTYRIAKEGAPIRFVAMRNG